MVLRKDYRLTGAVGSSAKGLLLLLYILVGFWRVQGTVCAGAATLADLWSDIS